VSTKALTVPEVRRNILWIVAWIMFLMTTFFVLAAYGQTVAPVMVQAPGTVDFTSIAVAVIGGIFSVIGIFATYLINSRMKDTQAAAALSSAVNNSLGAAQNAIKIGLTSHPLQASIPGISASTAAATQYVLDHASEEATRFGVTPAAIADKIEAKIGLQSAPTPPVTTPVTVIPDPPPLVLAHA
jgi:hypothetical protein